MQKVEVVFYKRCISYDRENVSFGSWHKDNDIEVDRVRIVPENEKCYGEVFELDLEAVDEVSVLWIEKSDGDSFGQETGLKDFVWVFTDHELAVKVRDEMKEAFAYRAGNRNFVFQDEKGKEITVFNPENDYFTSINQIHLNRKPIR